MPGHPIDELIEMVLLRAGILPELATDNDLLIADNMLMRADGSIHLAAQYLRAYKESHPNDR